MTKRSKIDTDATKKLLLREALHSMESRYFHRLHALLLLASGKSCGEVARILDCSPRTIQDWTRRFAENGLQGLKDRDRTGRTAALDEREMKRLTDDLRLSPETFGLAGSRWSGNLLMAHLADKYGRSLGLRQCQRLLRNLASSGIALAIPH